MAFLSSTGNKHAELIVSFSESSSVPGRPSNWNKRSMAYHKLPDVQHAMRWVEIVLGESGSCNGDIEKLRNGVLFCGLVSRLLDHSIDLSQVRKQGNPEMMSLHNLALLNRSLSRYNIKIPIKLQVCNDTPHYCTPMIDARNRLRLSRSGKKGAAHSTS
jgi:hypothetical protein